MNLFILVIPFYLPFNYKLSDCWPHQINLIFFYGHHLFHNIMLLIYFAHIYTCNIQEDNLLYSPSQSKKYSHQKTSSFGFSHLKWWQAPSSDKDYSLVNWERPENSIFLFCAILLKHSSPFILTVHQWILSQTIFEQRRVNSVICQPDFVWFNFLFAH